METVRDKMPVLSTTPAAATAHGSALEGPLDFSTVLAAFQAISGQSDLPALQDTLLRAIAFHCGAQHIFLLQTDDAAALYLAADAELTDDDGHVSVWIHSEQAETPVSLPLELLHQTQQQRQSVLLTNIDANHPFSSNPAWIKRHPKTVFCLPLVRQATCVGILYLEHYCLPNAFSTNQIALLELLATQAVLALDNAILHQHLLEKDKQREKTEAALTLKRIILRTLVETCPFRIFAKDMESRFIFANMNMARLTGAASAEELLGKTDYDFLKILVHYAIDQGRFIRKNKR